MNGKVLKNNRRHTTLATAERRTMIFAIIMGLRNILRNDIFFYSLSPWLITARKNRKHDYIHRQYDNSKFHICCANVTNSRLFSKLSCRNYSVIMLFRAAEAWQDKGLHTNLFHYYRCDNR